MTINATKYVVDEKGRKKAVLLDIKEYSRLLARLEEMEDTLDLDKAIRQKQGFRDYREVREGLLTKRFPNNQIPRTKSQTKSNN